MSEFTPHIIDEYLLGQLSAEAQEQFEEQLRSDPAFAREVEKRKVLISKVDAYGDYEVKQQLRKVHQIEMRRRAKIKWMRWSSGAIAAMLLLLLTYWFVLRPVDTLPPEQLYIAYYETYPLNFTLRDGQSEKSLAEADRLYHAGRFGEALPLFERVLQSDSALSNVRMAIGICYMEAKQYNQALAQFQPLIEADFDPFKDQALWYTALAYLQQQKHSDTRQYLQQIIDNPRSVFHDQAKELYRQVPTN